MMNGEKKQNQQPDRRGNRTILGRTIFLMGLFGVVIFIPLLVRLYDLQITNHEYYQELAISQQTRDVAVTANRGTIYDSKGTPLALSSTAYDIIVSPRDLDTVQENYKKKLEAYQNGESKTAPGPEPTDEAVASGLAEILGMDKDTILLRLQKDTSYVRLAAKVEQDVNEQVMAFKLEYSLSNALYSTPTSKRYYPHSSLAAQVIGFVNSENEGAYGMEAYYDSELSGETGRVVTAKNGNGTEMLSRYENYYDATDGNNLNLTIDATIQYYCERALEKGIEMYDVQNGGFAIAMDPNTGTILAWANSPTYDLNNPSTVTDPDTLAELETLKATYGEDSDEYKEALGNAQLLQWRNKAINDTYEPGSTFKSVVLAAALEEGVVSESDTFECTGSVNIAGSTIRCSDRKGHGTQTLAKAVANSCNPAFIAIGQRLGAERFYDYLEDFGFLETTGIDMQGEANSTVWSREWFTGPYGEASLATASFGQRFNVTPIQLITAASAVINGGHLMQPYVLESITDADGNVIQSTEPTERRQVVSEATSEKCRTILEGVVNGGTGKNAYQAGYRIGGKTGSSETLEDDHTIVSFLGFAPADDPQVVILIAFDNPKPVSPGSNYTAGGYYISGGVMGATRAGELLANILDYMGVEKQYTAEELSGADVLAPSVTGLSLADAQAKAEAVGLTVRTVGDGETVTDQIPIQGASIPGGSEMVLYMGEAKPTDQVEVPDLSGKSPETVRQTLSNLGLYMKATGVSDYYTSSTIAAGQSIAAGTMVDRGTVVEVQFMDNTATTAGAGF
ncbi:MAG: PASTA domain-containing protein [Pseudoflavonifractor capillosus]|uniref:penicillin-binding transpeptidase domain-containing protein n=1 Tax=Pseudoflavonifractor capillosus TaxID=106588 RepID=UPI0023F84A97|nr:penicillin-binding transpeptidase domain-containing protein [Pseudoflavonifractor capillosus]MCI5928880.1 PASTA domain-containing protein [Pseudoflavonifractor capillosus]MDY4660365.1 penicillin-binding transpeptidase domain-containing protein [Pseudoflavonifractor capillosus]